MTSPEDKNWLLFELYRCVELFCPPRSREIAGHYQSSGATLSSMDASRLLMNEPPFPEPPKNSASPEVFHVVISSLYLLPPLLTPVLQILDRMLIHPHLEIYLWTGPNMDFTRLRPLKSIKELLQKLPEIKIEDAEVIKAHLEREKDSEYWIAVTDFELEELTLLHPFHQEGSYNPHLFADMKRNMDDRTLLAWSRFPALTQDISPEDFQIVKNHFSYPLILEDAKEADVYGWLKTFPHHRRLILRNFKDKTLNLQEFDALIDVKILTTELGIVTLTPPPYLKRLQILGDESFDITQYPHLEELRLIVPENTELGRCSLRGKDSLLRYLEVVSLSKEFIFFEPPSCIEILKITNFYLSQNFLDFSPFTSLKKLNLVLISHPEFRARPCFLKLPKSLYAFSSNFPFSGISKNLPNLEVFGGPLPLGKQGINWKVKKLMDNFSTEGLDCSALSIFSGFVLPEVPSLRTLILKNFCLIPHSIESDLQIPEVKELRLIQCIISPLVVLPQGLEMLDISFCTMEEGFVSNSLDSLRFLKMDNKFLIPRAKNLSVLVFRQEDYGLRFLSPRNKPTDDVLNSLQILPPEVLITNGRGFWVLENFQREEKRQYPFLRIPVVISAYPRGYEYCLFSGSHYVVQSKNSHFYLSVYPFPGSTCQLPSSVSPEEAEKYDRLYRHSPEAPVSREDLEGPSSSSSSISRVAPSSGVARRTLQSLGLQFLDSHTAPKVSEKSDHLSLPEMEVFIMEERQPPKKIPSHQIFLELASIKSEGFWTSKVTIQPHIHLNPEGEFRPLRFVQEAECKEWFSKEGMVSVVRGCFPREEWWVLPSAAPCFKNDFQAVVGIGRLESGSINIAIFYDDRAKAFKFSLDRTFTGTLYFHLEKPNFCLLSPVLPPDFLPQDLPASPCASLNQKIQKAIASCKAELQEKPELMSVFSKKTTLFEKLLALANYCDPRECESTLQGDHLPLEKLPDFVLNPQGACRHRAALFYLLCLYFKLSPGECYYSIHPNHAQVVLIFQGKTLVIQNHHSVQAIVDLKQNQVSLLPPSLQNAFLENPRTDPASSASISRVAEVFSEPVQEEERELKFYKNWFANFYQIKSLTNPEEILEWSNAGGSFVGTYSSSSLDAFFLLRQVISKRLWLIDSLKSLRGLQKGFYLSKGRRDPRTSPIMSKDCLVLDWTILNPSERLHIQAGLSPLNIIYLLAAHDREGLYSLPPELPLVSLTSIRVEAPEKEVQPMGELVFDMHYREDFLGPLLGEVSLEHSKFCLKTPGLLAKACQDYSQSLKIYHPSPSCQQYLNRIRRLGYYETYLEPTGVSFEVPEILEAESVSPLPLSSQLAWKTEAPLREQRLYLNAYNLEDCFKSFEIDEEGRATIFQQGWLDDQSSYEKTLYFTGHIAQAQWVKFLQALSDRYPDRAFSAFLAPGARIEGVAREDAAVPEHSIPHLYTTNDPGALAASLALCLENARVFYLTPQTTYLELIQNISCDASREPPLFIRQEGALAEDLRLQKRIVLVGPLTDEIYHSLQQYFDNDQLYWVGLPSQAKKLHLSQAPEERLYYWEDYQEILRERFPRFLLGELQKFYEYLRQWGHKGVGRPKELVLTLRRLASIVERLIWIEQHPEDDYPHPHHPIKGLLNYDYPKNSEDYAYFNVAFTVCFPNRGKSWERNSQKLASLIQDQEVTPDNCHEYFWRIINCLGRAEILSLFSEGFCFSPEILEKLKTYIQEYRSNPVVKAQKTRRAEKRFSQLEYLIHRLHFPWIFLKGPPGVGKTHQIRHLLPEIHSEARLFDGQGAIPAWKQEFVQGRPAYLLLDEANLQEDGSWDGLRGLGNIFVTGNPESMPGRHYHRMFQEEAEIVYFDQPDDGFVKATFLRELESTVQNNFLRIVHLKNEVDPLFPCTLRDIQNFKQRLMSLLPLEESEDYDQKCLDALLSAALLEFSMSIGVVKNREIFIENLAEWFGQTTFSRVQKSLASEAHGVRENFPLSWKMITKVVQENWNRASEDGVKKGVLLETPLGSQKAELFQYLGSQIFVAGILSLATHDSAEIKKELLQAFHEGKPIALILSPEFEEILNQLLTGSDFEGRPPQHPGFFALLSCPEISVLSTALKNRVQCFYHTNYTEEELKSMAPLSTQAFQQAYRLSALPFSVFQVASKHCPVFEEEIADPLRQP